MKDKDGSGRVIPGAAVAKHYQNSHIPRNSKTSGSQFYAGVWRAANRGIQRRCGTNVSTKVKSEELCHGIYIWDVLGACFRPFLSSRLPKQADLLSWGPQAT